MEKTDICLKRPLPKVVEANKLSKEFLSSIKLRDLERKVNLITYNTDEGIEDFTVSSALEIEDNALEHIEKCINSNKKVNAFFEGDVNVGKTTLQKHLNKDIRRMSEDYIAIHLTGSNALNYSILYDNVLKDNEGNIIETIKFDKFFKGEDKESVKFEKIDYNSAITNFNNFCKLLDLLESLNKKYIIIFDECHAFTSEILFRNSEMSDKDADSEEVQYIMDMFQEGMDRVLSHTNKYSLGALWFTATPDCFEGYEKMKFTKVFRLHLKEEYKVKTSLLKPVRILGKSEVARLSYIAECLEKGPEDLVLAIFLNRKKAINKLVPNLKSFLRVTGKYTDDEIEKMIAIFYRDDKNAKNEPLQEVIKDSIIPSYVKIIFATSYVNVGLEMIEESRPVDVLLFVVKDTFSLISEVQFNGRFRRGVRVLHLIANEFSCKKMMSYKDYLNYKKQDLRNMCNQWIKTIKLYAKVNEVSLVNAKKSLDNGNIKSGLQCISIKNNKCCINEDALYNTAFLIYQQDFTLSSFDSLINAIYNHKTMCIENVAKTVIKDYTGKTLEDLGITKEKKEKTSTVKDTNNAIKNINKLINKENESYVRKAVKTGDTSYLNYNIEVEDEYGETSLLIVDNSEIKKELSILFNSNRYKNASLLFKEGEKNVKYNEDIIDKILDLKIKNPYFSEKKKEQKVKTVNTAVYEAPVQKQDKVKNEIKKVINEADFIIDSKVALLNTDKLNDYKNVNGTRLSDIVSSNLFENLMYSGVVELEFNKIIEKLNRDSILNPKNLIKNNEKIKLLEVKWNQDGTPYTKYDKDNSYHKKLILKVVKLYFNISKTKTGWKISSAKDSYKIQ